MQRLGLCSRSLTIGTALALLALGGCAPVLESTVDPLSADQPVAAENLTVSPQLGKHPPRLVAVLQVENATPDPEAAAIVRRLFYGNFSALPFVDIELARADGVLQATPDAAAADLARRLGADAYVRGRVLRFERNYYGVYADLVADLEFSLVATDSGETLWQARVEEARHSVSLSLSPLGLAVGLASNALEISRLALVRTANDACRRLVASIPAPGAMGGRPEIRELLHNGLGRVLRRGDRIEVALEGTPGLAGTFGIPGLREALPLREAADSAGRYLGAVVLPDGIEEEGLLLEAALTNDRGEAARWVDPLGALRIDTQPPPQVEPPWAEAGDGRVDLGWAEPGAGDLAGFLVLRSQEPLQGYAVVRETQGTAVQDAGLRNGAVYYYKVQALDLAGNAGEPSLRIAATPVAPGPVAVRGRLSGAVFWARAGGPYVLDGDVEVPPGASLTIEAGTRVRGAPQSRLRVLGRLLALGTEERLITFGPATDDGGWGGVAVEGAGTAGTELNHTLVEGAHTGVYLLDSAPRLERVRVRGCGTGIAVEGPEANPRLLRVLVYENDGPGLAITRFAAPLVAHSKVFHNRGPGIALTNGGGVVFQSEITGNGGGGVSGQAAALRLGYSRVHGNQGFELHLQGVEHAWPSLDLNYWGDPAAVEAGVSVPVRQDTLTVLSRPDPEAAAATVDLLSLPPPEGLADGLWIRHSLRLAAPESGILSSRPPFVVGVESLEQGEFSAAAEAFEQAVRLDPTDPESNYWLGLARLRLEQGEPAIEALLRACLLDVKNLEYRRSLARAYLATGQRAAAELTLAEVLRLAPGDAAATQTLEQLRKSGNP